MPSPRWPTLFALATLMLSTLAHAAADCHYQPIAELPIRLVGASNEPLIDGSINGTPAPMLIGINQTHSQLTRAAAEQRGLPLEQTGKTGSGAGGNTQIYGVKLQDFAVGAIHSGAAGMPVIGEMGFKPNYDAIVGAEFLFQADMELSLLSKQLKFFRADGCADTFLAYWDKDAMEIPFIRSTSRQLSPRFYVTINGKQFEAALSTFSGRSSINVLAAEQAGVRVGGPGVTAIKAGHGIGSEAIAKWEATFTTFTLGSETIENPTLTILDTPVNRHGTVDVILGRDFLRAHRVLFAMSQQRLYVSYTGGEVFYKPLALARPAPAPAAPAGRP